jgi:hypothetical protein
MCAQGQSAISRLRPNPSPSFDETMRRVLMVKPDKPRAPAKKSAKKKP